MNNIDMQDYENYSETEKEIIIKLLTVKERLDLIDNKLSKSLNHIDSMLDKLQKGKSYE
jgi:hypothetical protein